MNRFKMICAHMRTAENYAELSKATRLKVGAILVNPLSDSILAIGYNGLPAGFDDTKTEIDGVTNPLVVHAEMNVLKKLWKSTETATGAHLYVTHSPCMACAIAIRDAGIKAVFYQEQYRDIEGIHFLAKHDVAVRQVKEEGLYRHHRYEGQFLEPSEKIVGL